MIADFGLAHDLEGARVDDLGGGVGEVWLAELEDAVDDALRGEYALVVRLRNPDESLYDFWWRVPDEAVPDPLARSLVDPLLQHPVAALQQHEPIPEGFVWYGDDHERLVEKWSFAADALQATATDDNVVYVVHTSVTALSLHDGRVLWEFFSDKIDLDGAGGCEVGRAGDELVVFAPFEYEVRLDARTGRRRKASGARATLPGFIPLRVEPVLGYRVENDLTGARGFAPDGRLAWSFGVVDAQIDPTAAIGIGDAILLGLADSRIVLLAPERQP